MPKLAMQALIEKCEEMSELFGSLAHPVRLKVLCRTLEGEKTVNELTEFCGISQSGMSQFLARMKSEGLLDSRKDGTRVFYRIRDARISKILKAIKEICL